MKKTYILDTNILLSDPKSIYSFEENDIIIPLIVLEELDKFKNRQDDVGKNSRFVSRELDHLRNEGDLLSGVKLKTGGILKIVPFEKFHNEELEKFAGLSDNADNQIILFAKSLSAKNKNVVLLSKDVNVRIKSDSLGVKCEDYLNLRAVSSVEEFYTGVTKISLTTDDIIKEIYENGSIDIKEFNKLTDYIEKPDLFPNQIVILKNDRNVNTSATSIITKYDADNKLLKKIFDIKEVFGLKPKNKEQKFALDLLLDDHIKLVTLMGPSGTGKTLMALVSGLDQLKDVGENGKYDKLIITRPVVSVDSGIGWLPGPQPLDAEVLSPNGWVKMGNIKEGDFVIAKDGQKSKVEKVFPKGEKEVFKLIFSDGTSTECCEDHLWLIKQINDDRVWKIKSLKEIMQLDFLNNKIEIPFADPVLDFETQEELYVDPYILGCLLGDGDISSGVTSISTADDEILNTFSKYASSMDCKITRRSKYSYRIVGNKKFTGGIQTPIYGKNENGDVLKYKSYKQAEEDGYSRSGIKRSIDNKTSYKNYFWFLELEKFKRKSNSTIKNFLIEEGVYGFKCHDKFIPNKYKYSKINERLALLQGLMDTDGYVSKNGDETSFCSVSKQLAEDVAFLVRSLGGKAKIRKKIFKECTSYNVRISFDNELFCPFRLKRKVQRWHPVKIRKYFTGIESVGKKLTQCIKIDNFDHLYITNDFIVTHNTLEEKMEPWIAPIKDNLSFLLNSKNGSPKRKSKTSNQQHTSSTFNDPYFDILRDQGKIEVEAISFIRGRSLPNAYIIVEESQNLSIHELKTILTRVGHGTKIVLTGDIEQIDDSHLDIFTNGLSHCVQKFKNESISGHVTLIKGERSELATIASKIL